MIRLAESIDHSVVAISNLLPKWIFQKYNIEYCVAKFAIEFFIFPQVNDHNFCFSPSLRYDNTLSVCHLKCSISKNVFYACNLLQYQFWKPILDLIKAAKIRTRLIKYMKIIFEDVDFLVTPTCGQTPEPIHEGDSECKFLNIALWRRHNLSSDTLYFRWCI